MNAREQRVNPIALDKVDQVMHMRAYTSYITHVLPRHPPEKIFKICTMFWEIDTPTCSSAPACASESAEWAHFADFLQGFWSDMLLDGVAAAHCEARPAPAAPAHSAWDKLLASPTTQQLVSMRKHPAFATVVLPAVAAPRGRSAAQPPPAVGGAARAAAVDVLGALHSVFEDLQLNQLAWRHVPHLAALLATLSAQAGAKHWQVRDTVSLTACNADIGAPCDAKTSCLCPRPDKGGI